MNANSKKQDITCLQGADDEVIETIVVTWRTTWKGTNFV